MAGGDPPLIAFVTFYRDQTKAYETEPIAVEPQAGTRLGVTPIRITVRLGELPPGEYQCQVSVLDPANRRASFWQGRMRVEH